MNKTTELPKEIKDIKDIRSKFNNTEINEILESISNDQNKIMKSLNDNINNALNTRLQEILNRNKILMKSFNKNLNSTICQAFNSYRLQQISNIQLTSISKINTLQKIKPIINLTQYDFPISKQLLKFNTPISKQLLKYDFPISKQWFDSIRSSMDVYINKLNEIDNINRLTYKFGFEDHQKASYKFYQKNIFPPINYLIHEEIYDIDDDFDIKEFILGDEVNRYYLKAINNWKYKYDDIYTQKLISEIGFNLEYKNSFSIIVGISMLMEHMLNRYFPEYIPKNTKRRYYHIKSLLEEKVFIPLNINYLYRKFIKNNLYNSTDKAPLFSRHMVHGNKLESATMENAMNMIFIYDFIQEILLKKVTNIAISY